MDTYIQSTEENLRKDLGAAIMQWIKTTKNRKQEIDPGGLETGDDESSAGINDRSATQTKSNNGL